MLGTGERKTRLRGRGGRQSFSVHFVQGFIRILVLAVLILIVWYGARMDVFTLRSVVVSGGETILHDEVRSRAENELEGTYFKIVPKRFVYLYPHDRIREVLMQNTRIEEVVIDTTSRKELTITFSEHMPHALWCVADRADIPCYYITEDGFAFEEAPVLLGGSMVRHYTEGIQSIDRGEVISREKLSAINAVVARMERELLFRIASLRYTMDGDIVLSVNGGGEIFMSGQKDFDSAFLNVQSVLATPEFQHITPGHFDYIDARFENKVFVKEFQSTTTEPVATTTDSVSE